MNAEAQKEIDDEAVALAEKEAAEQKEIDDAAKAEIEANETEDEKEARLLVEAEEAAALEDEGELVISIGDEEIKQEETTTPDWVKEVRKLNKAQAREIKELKRNQQPAPDAVVVGKKPTMEDVDYDADRFEQKLSEWHERKGKADEQAAELEADQEKQTQSWNNTLQSYETSKADLKVKDYVDAEAVVMGSLNEVQQGVVLSYAKNPALLVWALGKNPSKVKEFASITDNGQFLAEVVRWETELKTSKRKPTSKPEGTVNGTAPKGGIVDAHLDKLEEDAERTGDRTKVIAYKREKRGRS